MAQIPEAVLSSGEKMPLLAMGTAAEHPLPGDLAHTLVHAMGIGYRHFDTASLYGSEQAVGEAIAQALRHRIVQSRTHLFITSKLWITDAHHDRVLPALKKSLE
ncbi:hypothetical protein ACLOJK_025539 [Asimina triloba]